MYRLNANSYSARFYSWIWNTNVTEMKNMCPYFWGYVLTIPLLPILLLIKGMAYLIKKIPISSKRLDNSIDRMISTGEKIASYKTFWYYVGKFCKWILIFALGILIFTGLIGLVIIAIKDPILVLATIGGTTLLVLTLFGVLYVGIETNLFKVIWKFLKLCGNMVYGLYKNMCPVVIWEK